MTILTVDEFDNLTNWTTTGSPPPTVGAAGAWRGSNGLIIDTTGGAQAQFLQTAGIPVSTAILNFRFYLNIQTRPGSGNNIYVALNGTGDMKLVLLATGALRAQCGSGTAQTSSVLSTSAWHLIEGLFQTGGSTATIDWRIDEVAQTQASAAQASSLMTYRRMGITGVDTVKMYFDTYAEANTTANYPLGANPKSVSAGIATGVSSTHVVVASDLGTRTGIGTGTGLANNATISQSNVATAEIATGIGAVLTARPKFGAPAGSGSGTGAAYVPLLGTDSDADAGTANGVGESYDAHISSRTFSVGNSLTIHMG